jgi:hypothetical protein
MQTQPRCPRCDQPLVPEGMYLRCTTHGLFFRYGPRRLLAAPMTVERHEPLLPWQTLSEEPARKLSLPTSTTAAATK